MQKRNVLSSPRLEELKKKRRSAAIKRSAFLFGAAVILLFSLVYVSRVEGLNIQNVEIAGNNILESDDLQSAVRKELTGKYIWLFPKSNVLIFPRQSLEESLRESFPRISSLSFSLSKKETLSVDISEREGKYIWCGVLPPVPASSEEEKCYFLDESGYVFDDAPYFSGEVYFKFYGEGGLGEDPMGKYFRSQDCHNLIKFKDALSSFGLKPVMISLLQNGNAELYLSRVGREGYGPKIIFKIDSDANHIAENLQAALGTEPLMSGFKKKYASLQYIDLRFGNKVYFKFNE